MGVLVDAYATEPRHHPGAHMAETLALTPPVNVDDSVVLEALLRMMDECACVGAEQRCQAHTFGFAWLIKRYLRWCNRKVDLQI
jgi:hypothetical protein